MCHGDKNNGKTVRYKTDNPKHKDAVPYKRLKKKNLREYEEY
jgi:hypothetical protein